MKLAFVCDDLIQFGGAERVFLAVVKHFPNSHVYASVVSKPWKKILKDHHIEYSVSFMQYLPFVEKLYRYYSVLFLHVLAFRLFDFSQYDLVFSFSARYAHHIKVKSPTKHLCYMHSPGRMFWEPFDYFEKEGPLSRLVPLFLLPLRMLDFYASLKVDKFFANSKTVKKRIRKYYGRKSEVFYPFVETKETPSEVKDFFLVVSRLVSWKKIDLAILACKRYGYPLKIVGEGPDLSRLKKLASKNVEFLGYVTEEQKQHLMASCKALLFPQTEDFGLTPLEVMSQGRPVVAHKKGGALETILFGITGDFFTPQTVEGLSQVLQNFDATGYDPVKCKAQAAKFSKQKFMQFLEQVLNDVY